VLGEGTLCYKVMLIIYRVCLEKVPWQSNAVIIQGVLGKGTLQGYKVMLMIYRVCFKKEPWVMK